MVVHVMSNERYYRTDIAASLADKPSVAVVGARERPEVLIVETTAKILVGLIIGFSCTVILACFGMIVYFRNHRVMTMAQAGLLGWLTVSCFLTAFLAFLVLPTRDSFCQYSSLAFIPASMTVSIMIGRLFRVYSTLGKAHRLGKNEKGGTTRMVPRSRKAEEMVMTTLSFLAFTRFFGDSQSRTRRASSSLRRTTTRKDSVRLILVLSLPQVVMQIVRVCLYDGGLIFEYDKDLLTARQICDDTGFRWARYAGLTLVLLQYMLCLFIAWCSRDLPAAFNETSKIFKAAMWGGIIVLATVLLQIFFDLPTTSPSLSVRSGFFAIHVLLFRTRLTGLFVWEVHRECLVGCVGAFGHDFLCSHAKDKASAQWQGSRGFSLTSGNGNIARVWSPYYQEAFGRSEYHR